MEVFHTDPYVYHPISLTLRVRQKLPSEPLAGTWPVDTLGGRFHAEWDDQAPVPREGQLITQGC